MKTVFLLRDTSFEVPPELPLGIADFARNHARWLLRTFHLTQANLKANDVITALGGRPITGEADLLTALALQKPGDTVTLTLGRTGTTLTVRVRLAELAASA